jgi:DNA-binding transcriptional regulator GbsR (MarR family)
VQPDAQPDTRVSGTYPAGSAVASPGPAHGPHDAAVRRFVERFALLLTDAGWPRMAARVFSCLLADEQDRLTAGELAARLGVSPAAVSGAVRYLVQLGLIVRGREPGARSDHYHVEHGMWQEQWMRQSGRMHHWVDSLSEGIAVVGPDSAAGRRLDETRAFFAFLEMEMDGLMQRWRERRGGH